MTVVPNYPEISDMTLAAGSGSSSGFNINYSFESHNHTNDIIEVKQLFCQILPCVGKCGMSFPEHLCFQNASFKIIAIMIFVLFVLSSPNQQRRGSLDCSIVIASSNLELANSSHWRHYYINSYHSRKQHKETARIAVINDMHQLQQPSPDWFSNVSTPDPLMHHRVCIQKG